MVWDSSTIKWPVWKCNGIAEKVNELRGNVVGIAVKLSGLCGSLVG
jgi:hypothetical protein